MKIYSSPTERNIIHHVQLHQNQQIALNRNQSSKNSCRICFESESQQNLISPCLCKGSIQCIHEECIKSWIIKKNGKKFKLSGSKYEYIVCEMCKNPIYYQIRFRKQCNKIQFCKDLNQNMAYTLMQIIIFIALLSLFTSLVVVLFYVFQNQIILEKINKLLLLMVDIGIGIYLIGYSITVIKYNFIWKNREIIKVFEVNEVQKLILKDKENQILGQNNE